VFIVQQETLCHGDSILIDGQWVSAAGQYTYIHSDPVTLCDTIFDVFVTVSEELFLHTTTDWNCQALGSASIEISGADPFHIEWSNGLQNDTVITNLDDGLYTVLVSDINGCTQSDTFEITSPPSLTFSIPSSFTMYAGDSILINVTGDTQAPGLTYEWAPAGILSCATCSSTYAAPDQDTLVTVVISDQDSCDYILETFIYVTVDSNSIDQIYTPNVFSPNGDGINDYWRIFSKLENTHVQELYIYDRWGTVVFAKRDFVLNTHEGWDGKLNGKPMNPGVFVYQAKLTLGDGREVKVKGDITLLR
jgi:gliding motility-associated-like protein